MDDIEYQLRYVAEAAWRLMAMQDDNPVAPSHGCFHTAYWRDKTSEFPDARYQEAGAALALLAHPAFEDLRQDTGAPDPERLMAAFRAGLGFSARIQYADGCFDEWYKGERGFAATAFVATAYGFVVWLMGDRLKAEDRELAGQVMARAARWLAGHDDNIKSNHQAAAAAALALAWGELGEDDLKRAARAKVDDVLARQTAEGWFPEIGGMDLGYCSVMLDYLMIYSEVTGDHDAVPAMGRLYRFLLPHIQPDLTVHGRAGLCLNPYLGRLGVGLLSPHDADAAAVAATFAARNSGVAGLRATLGDDLRLARWSAVPVVTAMLRDRFEAGGGARLEDVQPAGWTLHAEAGAAAYHGGGWHLFATSAGGGAVRIFQGQTLILDDAGYVLRHNGRDWSCQGYDPGRGLEMAGPACRLSAELAPAGFHYPGFLSRLVLRLGSTTRAGSVLLRSIIDALRLRRRSAVNQSAAAVAGGGGAVRLVRSVEVGGGGVTIVDELEARFPLSREMLSPLMSVGGAGLPAFDPANRITISKLVGAGGEIEVRVEEA